MADDKKKFAAPEGAKWNLKNEAIYILIGLFFLAIVVNRIMYFFTTVGWQDFGGSFGNFARIYLLPLWNAWKVFGVTVAALSVVLVIYAYSKLQQVISEEKKVFDHHSNESDEDNLQSSDKKENNRWANVLIQAHSNNESEWRSAIIEADVMLEEVLRARGYHGESVGEMLKSAEGPDQFTTLDSAWEGHKIRNRIAHGGSNFQLNEREVRRAISHFEAVFSEFGII